jgi:lipopolysaccharide/colanic/teichoic acid biosynthesis glycosyltransferase
MRQDAIIDWQADVAVERFQGSGALAYEPGLSASAAHAELVWPAERHFGPSRPESVVKRAFDVLVSTLALVVCAPLMLLIALAIRIDSPGPALFQQSRVGRRGRQFEILKFRTMTRDAERRKEELRAHAAADDLFKIPADPRVTRIGRILRRTSLDELPQLVNVLRGEMSLVGPRPLIPAEDRRIEGVSRQRLTLLPGITGLWQVTGPERPPLVEMVHLDVRYGATWSIWRDVAILVRTVPYVLLRRGM